jgi:hypothetical protein
MSSVGRRSALMGAASVLALLNINAKASNLPPLIAQGGRKKLGVLLNSVDVTDYGAIDDLLRGYYTCTWSSSSPTITSAYTYVGQVTVQNNGTYNGQTVATLQFPNQIASTGLGFGEDWIGKPIAITGAGTSGGTFIAVVTDFDYLPRTSNQVPTWTLDRVAPTTVTASSQSMACPCFSTGSDGSGFPSDVGKTIVVSDALNASGNVIAASGLFPNIATISAVNSPFSVTLSANSSGNNTANFSTAKSSFPGVFIRWFTDNHSAMVNAGFAARGQGRTSLLFSGFRYAQSTGVFGAIGLNTSGIFNDASAQFAHVASQLDWWTSGGETETDVISSQATSSPASIQEVSWWRQAIPFNAPPPSSPADDCGGTAFPVSATLASVPVVITGDSWTVEDPSGDGNNSITLYQRALQRKNKSKKVNVQTRGIGGTRWLDLYSSANVGGTVNVPPWKTSTSVNWLSNYVLSIPDPNANGTGSVVPGLVIIAEGSNDTSALHPTHVWGVLNRIKSVTAANGLPPDILLVTEGTKGSDLFSAGGEEGIGIGWNDYDAGYVRSVARANKLPLIDFATRATQAQYGFNPWNAVRKIVPPLSSGSAAATAPYTFPGGYKSRSHRFMLQLGNGTSTTGAQFWTAIKTLEIQLSPKPDNRLVLSTDQTITGDAGGNLYVYHRSWGYIISTPCTISNGSNALATSGQTNIGTAVGGFINNGGINFILAPNGGYSGFASGQVGSCLRVVAADVTGEDYRTSITAFTNSGIIGVTDDNINATALTSSNVFWQGGWMFTPRDAVAQANIRITDGSGNTLRSSLTAYTDFQHVTLKDNWTFTGLSASSVTVEFGRFTAPACIAQVAAASDAGIAPLLIVDINDAHVRVSYMLGSGAPSDPRSSAQTAEQIIWEGDVEQFGGAWSPQIWATGGTVNLQAVWCEIEDRRRVYTRPLLSVRDAMAVGDTKTTFPLGGDTSHYSRRYMDVVMRPVIEAQNLTFKDDYSHNAGTNTPTTGFTYTIPPNQAFTGLTPAGTLATGAINLPSVFPQGTELIVSSSQTITACTFNAPSGTTFAVSAPTSLSAGVAVGWVLEGTTWFRSK